MSFSYSGDPRESAKDWLRFKTGDTVESSVMLQDEELDYIVAIYAAPNQQLAVAFRQCASTLAAKLVKRSLGPQSEDATKRHEYFAAMANRYEKDLSYSGVPPLPDYESDKVFGKNMMANES